MSRTLADLGEFGLIDAITDDLALGEDVVVGPGDDCAVFTPRGDVVVSTDAMVEDVHFKRAWSGPTDVGRKAVAAAVADVEAMGARITGVVVSLTAPTDTPADWALGFSNGVRDECERAGASLLGGDITRGPVVIVGVTAFGDLDGHAPVLRSGARPGDVVAFIGRLGMAAAGLAVLNRGFRSPGAVVRAQRVPEVPYGQGRVARNAGATAMLDCSDGPLADLGHIARASSVSIDLRSSAFDVDEAQKTVAAAIGGGDPLNYILTGGEDHALLATFAPDDVPPGWTVIGTVTELEGEPTVTVDGQVWSADAGGWRHF